jgi:uncharacterized OB-fold protein
VAFPAERYGCERCGAPATDHEPVDLPAVGVVRSFAEVHRHHQPDPPAPFVVVQVDLPSGLSLKGVLAGCEVEVGDRVEGTIAEPDAKGGMARFRWRVAA